MEMGERWLYMKEKLGRCKRYILPKRDIRVDCKLLSGFPFIGHGKPDNNSESPCAYILLQSTARDEAEEETGKAIII
jgi:hypothetical protein